MRSITPLPEKSLIVLNLEDELEFDVDKFNRDIVLPNFNKTVLAEIAKDINPEGKEKTLIYAVNDDKSQVVLQVVIKRKSQKQ